MKQIDEHRCFGGWQRRYTHRSQALDCDMQFSVFLPPQAERGTVPVAYWLSGLTCTDENFVNKAGAQRAAAEHGIALVAPDTSPRGAGIPGEDDGYDLGTGAGFYVNATRAPWDAHYQMYDYVVDELPALLRDALPLDGDREAVFGHSMGGHGALVLALRNPGRYRSVSAFSPVCAPSQCPWGHKAFGAYLGDDRDAWRAYDATALVEDHAEPGSIPALLIEQGEADQFLVEQLKPGLLAAACEQRGVPITVNRRAGYDHSYFFIASFIDAHIAHHAAALTV